MAAGVCAAADIPSRQGLQLWLDASDAQTVAAEAGAVSKWQDKSGHAHDAVQEEPARRPAYVTAAGGGKPCVRFDGKDDYLVFPKTPLGDLAAFVVFRPRGGRCILLGDADNRNWLRVEADGVKAKWSNAATAVAGARPAMGQVQMLSVVRAGDALALFMNGHRAGRSTKADVFVPEHIGHKSTGGTTENFLKGDVHEVIIYSRALPDAERRQIEQYLIKKWGIDVAAAGGQPAPVSPSQADTGISHGPMLGAVSETTAALWLRTRAPSKVEITLASAAGSTRKMTLQTDASTDNTCVARFKGLEPDTQYRYEVRAGAAPFAAAFRTFGPSLRSRTVRLVYGYGYLPSNRMKNGSIFSLMAKRKADFVLFIGDFPYTRAGRRAEVRAQHKIIRSNPGFTPLTCGTRACAVWDDHDFGPNDCDGTHPYADEALAAFKEYWANPSYGEPGNKGIYSSFVIGHVEVFLLDGRYHARQRQENPTMLGEVQFRWLCRGLKASKARFKLLVSGTPFARVKRDCWGGAFYRAERERLFAFISANRISGVLAISGDIHRCDIHKLPMGNGQYLYDLTAGALARVHRVPPADNWPPEMLYSYGNTERNMFGEIDFHPPSDTKTAITFRSFSGKYGLSHRFTLTPADMGM